MLKKNTRRTQQYLIAFLGVMGFLALPLIVLGQGVDFGTDQLSGVGLGSQDIRVTVVNIIRVALGILGTITLVLIVYAGFVWMTSNGRPENIQRAKKIMINAVVGLLIIILAYAIVMFIFNQLVGRGIFGTGGSECEDLNMCIADCTYCNADGEREYNPSCFTCGIGSTSFVLEDVQTANGSGSAKNDVYLCSTIQPRFNNLINAPVALNSIASGNTGVYDSGGNQVAGSWQVAGNKYMSFDPANDWNANTTYEVRFGIDLEDSSGDTLQGCIGTTCETLPGTYYGWEFTTGTTNDATPPSVIDAYPALTTPPTRTMPRSPTIDVVFSEPISYFSVGDASGQPLPGSFAMQQVTVDSSYVVTGTVGAPLASSNFDVTLINADRTMRVTANGGFLLEPFTWYEITVQAATDLCSNVMMPAPVSWVFQTSDAVPGFGSWYPTGTNVCSDAGLVSFTSNVSLHDEPLTFVFDGNSTTHTFSEVSTSVDTGDGILSVFDSSAPYAENFKVFNFVPYGPLVIGRQYFVDIYVPGVLVNQDGDPMEVHWDFTVAEAGSCTCSPYISSLSPSQGAPGQCLTINGTCFAGTSASPGSVTNVLYDGVAQAPSGQSGSFVTSEVPSSYSMGESVAVSVEMTYDAPSPYGTLGSNIRNFFVNTDTAYAGPCLVDINPAAACNGAPIDLLGNRFGSTQGASEVVFSAGGPVQSSDIAGWADSKIDFDLPTGFGDSNVTVRVDGQTSNALPFDVSCGAGASCDLNSDPLICSPDATACSGTLQCINCICTDTGGGSSNSFVATAGNPNCSTACTNSEVSVQFSSVVDSTTVDTNTVALYRCADGSDCTLLVAETYTVSPAGTKAVFNSFTLQQGESYRVIVDQSVAGTNGIMIENINYDNPLNGVGSNDSYSWTFTVAATDCAVSSIDTLPALMSFSAVGQYQTIVGEVFTDQGCAGGQLLNSWDYDWGWTSDDAGIATVTDVQSYPPNSDPVQTVTAQSVGTTLVRGSAAGFADSTNVDVVVTFVESQHWPACNTACMNPEIGIQFNDVVDASTVGGSIVVGECLDATCSALSPLSFSFSTAGNQIIVNVPTLQPSTEYRVIVRGDHAGFAGVRSDDGALFGELTYDDPTYNGINGNDSYSWTFTTNDQVCSLTGVDVVPSSVVFTNGGAAQSLAAKALSEQGCTASPYIDPWDYSWAWLSFDTAVVTAANTSDPVTTITAVGNGGAQVESATSGFADVADVTVTISGSVGASCDADGDTGNGICVASSTYCNNDLYCEESSCTCQTPAAPTVLSVEPGSGFLQCRNSVFKVVFDQPMKHANAANFFRIDDIGAGGTIPHSVAAYDVSVGDEGCTWNDGCSVFVISPAQLLPPSSLIDLVVLAGMQSQYNQSVGSDIGYGYTTGTEVCELDGVEIFPGYWRFTSEIPPNNSIDYVAFAYSNNNGRVYLSPIPGVYNWSYLWTEDDPAAVIAVDGTPTDGVNTVSVPARAQGIAHVQVDVTLTEDTVFAGAHIGRKVIDIATADVFVCDFPWPEPPPHAIGWDAEMKYCRGNVGDTLLPALGAAVDLTTSGDLLLDRAFVVQHDPDDIPLGGSDIVGIRVYDNPNHISAAGWYELQDFPQGSPRSAVVDGYPAVVDGVTTYVHFVDVRGSVAYSYILVISHNQEAVSETIEIYNQLLDNIQFNVTALTAQGKQDIQQDMLRIGGMGKVIQLIQDGFDGNLDHQQSSVSRGDFSMAALVEVGQLPDLSSGTFIPGMTTSRWPQSWQGVLGNALGARLPVDPLNTFSFCPDQYDQASCFNTNLDPQFFCNEGSHIYIYTDGYVYGNLEYKGITWNGVGGSGDDTCGSFAMSYDGSTPPPLFSGTAPAVTIESSTPSSGGSIVAVDYTVSATGVARYFVDGSLVESRSVGPGLKTYTFSGLSGTHTLEIVVSNSYGSSSDNISYTVTSEPPTVSIENPANGSAGGSAVTISYTNSKSGVVTCSASSGQSVTLNNVPPGSSSCQLTGLPEQSLTLTVDLVANDGSGSATADIAYTVSTTAPSDTESPEVVSFSVTSGSAIIDWHVQDNEALSRVEIWRAADSGFGSPGSFAEIPSLQTDVSGLLDNTSQVIDFPSVGTWWYRIRVYDQAGNFVDSNTQSVFESTSGSVPATPTGLTAVFDDGGGTSTMFVQLRWTDTATDEDAFVIERSVGDLGSFIEIGSVAAEVEDFQDFDITVGNTYYYRVLATKGSSNSLFSNTASVIASVDITAPLVGTFTSQPRATDDAVTFSYTVTDNQDLESVQLRRAADNGLGSGPDVGTWVTVQTDSVNDLIASSSFSDLPSDGTWWYSLIVTDAAGNTTNTQLSALGPFTKTTGASGGFSVLKNVLARLLLPLIS